MLTANYVMIVALTVLDDLQSFTQVDGNLFGCTKLTFSGIDGDDIDDIVLLQNHKELVRNPSNSTRSASALSWPSRTTANVEALVAADDRVFHKVEDIVGLQQKAALFSDKQLGSKKVILREPSNTKLYSPGICAIIAALGGAVMTFGGIELHRSRQEIQKLREMEAAETNLEKLMESGSELPSVVIIKGKLQADDGKDVKPASPHIEGLKQKVGTVEQPANAMLRTITRALLETISRAARRRIQSIVETNTCLNHDDLPDIPEIEQEITSRKFDFKDEGYVLTEVLVQRLCVSTYKEESEREDDRGEKRKDVTITRTNRYQSYNIFHARKASKDLYLEDMKGQRLTLQLPAANMVNLLGLGEPPSLFLATADKTHRFMNSLRKDSLSMEDQHIDLRKMPPTKMGDPLTMLSKFIIIDVQSENDLGIIGNNKDALDQLRSEYQREAAQQFLWEPNGFYDTDRRDNFPRGATFKDRRLLSAEEFLKQAKQAGEENSNTTDFCEPTYSRSQLPRLRDDENCLRFTELAIPRGSPVTILARPVRDDKGGIRLVPPNSAQNGRDVDDPDAERYRFRILDSYSIENLVNQHNHHIMQDYLLALCGAFAFVYAAAGCPGMP